jgi:two-component sensor histidine kinase
MLAHELCTNAAKYGALSQEAGHVAVDWAIADGTVRISWVELGGPPVVPPARKGFGTRMIEGIVASDLGGRAVMEFNRDGLRCLIDIPIQPLTRAAAALPLEPQGDNQSDVALDASLTLEATPNPA